MIKIINEEYKITNINSLINHVKIHYDEQVPFCNEGATHIVIGVNKRNAVKGYIEGDYALWCPKKIKRAFNFGKGTIDDFKRFAEDNRSYITIIDLKTGEIL